MQLLNAIERDRNFAEILGRVSSLPVQEGNFMRFTIRSEMRLDSEEVHAVATTIETKDPRLMMLFIKRCLGDMVIIKGLISVFKNILAVKITSLGNPYKSPAVLLGSVKKAPMDNGEKTHFELESRESGRSRLYVTAHTVESSNERVKNKMRSLREQQKILVYGLFCNKRIIATDLVPVTNL
ncbi:MAG: hypothetical protein K8I29_19220 [Alphaproteobacteria bacterium]|uniref:Uncharacterized protein n=1 Tax=Candidatus Nitrobium versatile TaxID=2884831 RepID=A0A953M3Q6_9BACT|nr:hypothetical protein [Candidatus Nitrobium versatile]